MQRFALRPAAVAALLITIGAIRMATTFRVFSATADEATHIGAGLELFQYHRYLFQRENPPLPRLIMGIAPWLGGMRFNPRGTFTEQIHSVLYDHGEYRANLMRARSGNLLFFAIASIALFALARRELGEGAALVALFLFTMQPIVLGYAALATHDAAAVAGVAVALLAFSSWLQKVSLQSALLFGAAFGFSILCKFSSIAFAGLACAIIGVVRLIHDTRLRSQVTKAAIMLLPAAAATLLTIWAGYGFTVGSIGELQPWNDAFGPAVQRNLVRLGRGFPLPASDFFVGIAALLKIDQAGFLTYLCGKGSTDGWWWYFPFAITIKTTIATLVLFVSGFWFALRDPRTRWPFVEWSLGGFAVVALAMPSSLDLGIRYVLPFYIPFAIAGAAAAIAMLRSSRAIRTAAIALLVCHLGASIHAHPDYFPYFNAFAGRDPGRYLIDSNLDWGQDILRLRSVLRREHAPSLAQSLMGPADYERLGFPPVHSASPWDASHGWVAISEHSYRMTGLKGGWKWLPDKYQRVGKSIRLYSIP